MKVITITNLRKIIHTHGLNAFILDLVRYLKEDFCRWEEFDKSSRYAAHSKEGVIELMPICDDTYFFYKYVNGHPINPTLGKQTVIALGQLATVKDGYPLIISEMTILTAIRTAATAILASNYLARQDSQTLAIIGTGAQSEFQVLAHNLIHPIKQVKYFDIDPLAAQKFHHNLKNRNLEVVACASAQEAVFDSDIIVVCTACKNHVDVIRNDWIKPGTHINALGGDTPGKTELELSILFRGKVVVEYKEQSIIEGEIQCLSSNEVELLVYGELWELICGKKLGRERADEITIFDSVGFALEDYSTLRLVKDLSDAYGIVEDIDLIPHLQDPKNLFALLRSEVT